MLEHRFPVARMLADGEHDGQPYLLEESLGDVTLGDLFDSERASSTTVSADNFAMYLEVLGAYARAQAELASRQVTVHDDFRRLVGVAEAAEQLPELAVDIVDAFDRSTARLVGVPLSLVHADLHEHNMCARGVIDLEDMGWATAGYDVATAIFVPALCGGDLGEGIAGPAFSGTQVDQSLGLVDEVFSRAGLVKPSEHIEEFLVCRSIALC